MAKLLMARQIILLHVCSNFPNPSNYVTSTACTQSSISFSFSTPDQQLISIFERKIRAEKIPAQKLGGRLRT
jgi:hypothetical protein